MGIQKATIDGLWEELVKSLPLACRDGVFFGPYVSMVSTWVLQAEMAVEYFCKRWHTDKLIDLFSLVDKFMARKSIEPCHVTLDESKKNPVAQPKSMSIFKQKLKDSASSWIHIGDNAQAPKPIQCVYSDKGIQREHETFIFSPEPLRRLVKVRLKVVFAPKRGQVYQVGHPNRYQKVACNLVDNMGYHKSVRCKEIRSNISDESWLTHA